MLYNNRSGIILHLIYRRLPPQGRTLKVIPERYPKLTYVLLNHVPFYWEITKGKKVNPPWETTKGKNINPPWEVTKGKILFPLGKSLKEKSINPPWEITKGKNTILAGKFTKAK